MCTLNRKASITGSQTFNLYFNESEMSNVFPSMDIRVSSKGKTVATSTSSTSPDVMCSVNILGGESLQNVLSKAIQVFPSAGIEHIIKFLIGSLVVVTHGKDVTTVEGLLVSCGFNNAHMFGNGNDNIPKNMLTLFCPSTHQITTINCESLITVVPKDTQKLEEFQYYLGMLPMIQQG